MPVSDTLADPVAEPNTWKATVLDPWVDDVADASNDHETRIAALEAAGGGLSDTFQVASYIALGQSFTTALGNASAAADANGGGTVLLPAGTHTLTTGVTHAPTTRFVGPGPVACVINHTGNNTAFTCTTSDIDFSRPRYAGFTLTGSSGGSARGFHVGDVYYPQFSDLIIQDYTAGVGVELENVDLWTEAATFHEVNFRDCLTCLKLTKTAVGVGTESFAETRLMGVNFVLGVASSIGIDVGAGAFVVNGTWIAKCNIEHSTATFIRLAATSVVIDNFYDLSIESLGGGISIELPSGARFEGDGEFFGTEDIPTDIDPGATIDVGRFRPYLALPLPQTEEKTFIIRQKETTVSSDTDVLLLRGWFQCVALITVQFVGPSRHHTMTFYYSGNDFDPDPTFRIVSDYAFFGERNFGHPFQKRLSATDTNPHIYIPVANRNAGTEMSMTVQVIRGTSFDFNDLQLFPASAAGTLTSAEYGKGWEKAGATSVADGGTIAHGLPVTPTVVTVTPSVASEFVSVTALGATTFTCAIKKHDNTAGTTQTVYWRASKLV